LIPNSCRPRQQISDVAWATDAPHGVQIVSFFAVDKAVSASVTRICITTSGAPHATALIPGMKVRLRAIASRMSRKSGNHLSCTAFMSVVLEARVKKSRVCARDEKKRYKQCVVKKAKII
jgi:hypothetical protein